MIIAAGRERLREYILEELRLQIPRAEQAVDVSEEDRSQKERRTTELDRKKIANALDILEREARIREKEAVLARRLREIAERRARLPSRSTEKSRKRQTEPPQRKVLR